MKRAVILGSALALAVVGGACGSSNNNPNTPTNTPTVFNVTLRAANEVPPVSNTESNATGTAIVTITTVKDASGNITSATADFNVTMANFPNGSTAIAAHIHPGATGTNGSVLVSTGLSAANGIAMPNGTGSFSFNGVNVSATDATSILANPQNFYFNVHTTLNGGGAMRGQLR